MLTILPGVPGSVVRCTLERTDLVYPTKYAALSYCWGDAKTTTNIIVNDIECPVTVNLADALHQLRSLGVTRAWADAICINQADEEEKGHQIRYMKQIYSRSELTYAWLGKDELGVIGRAIFFLQVLLLDHTKLVDLPHSHSPLPPWESDTPIFATPSVATRRILPNDCQRCLLEGNFRALKAFLDLEYWKRRWIIQEIAAAPQVQIMCGNERIDLHAMSTAISRCEASCYWIEEVRSSYEYLKTVLTFRSQYQSSSKLLLIQAIQQSRDSLSTDPRDKIFSLLGICGDGTELVLDELRYQYPAEVLVCNITRAVIRKTGCLDLIVTKSTYNTMQNLRELPTWTPDWLLRDIPIDVRRLAERPRGRQQVLPSAADLPITSDILRVQGASIGKILDITSAAKSSDTSYELSDYMDRPIPSTVTAPPY
ncbi:MAG: hypothetical protein Q9160_000594 [Pyrenula sp. 1 TL-2023]